MRLMIIWLSAVVMLLGIFEIYARITSFDVKGEYFMVYFWILIISGIVSIFSVLLETKKEDDKG